MTEAQWQQRITDYCDYLRLTWHHEVDSRKSKRGFPDLVIAGSAVIFAELKTDTGRVSTEQAEWIEKLRTAGATVYIWRPRDWDEVHQTLADLAYSKPAEPTYA